LENPAFVVVVSIVIQPTAMLRIYFELVSFMRGRGMEAYKIFDLGADGPKTLFHGLEGSRTLPVGKWLDAEIKLVTDGSRAEPYESGFHAYYTLDDIHEWLLRAKNLDHRVVVKVEVKGCWEKPRAIRPTILAKRLKISDRNWKNRIPAREFLNTVTLTEA